MDRHLKVNYGFCSTFYWYRVQATSQVVLGNGELGLLLGGGVAGHI